MRKTIRLMLAGLAMLTIGLGVIPPAPEVQAAGPGQGFFNLSTVWIKASAGTPPEGQPEQFIWTELPDGAVEKEAIVNSGTLIPMATYGPLAQPNNNVTWSGQVTIREYRPWSLNLGGGYGPILYTGPLTFNSDGIAFFEGFTAVNMGGPLAVTTPFSQNGVTVYSYYAVEAAVSYRYNGIPVGGSKFAKKTRTVFYVASNGPDEE